MILGAWSWRGRLLGGAAIAASAAYLVMVIARYLHERDVAPSGDMLAVELFLNKLHRMPTLYEAFNFQDSEHRPVFPLYVFAVDHFYFASHALLPVLLSILSIAGACAVCLWRFLPAIGESAHKLAYLLIFPLVMFWPAHFPNLVWTKQLHACLSVFCTCTMFALAAGIDSQAGGRPPRREVLSIVAIVILIFVGAFSFGWGLLASFVIAGYVLWRRWPINRAAPVLAAVALTAALYASVSNSLHPGASLEDLGGAILPAASYILRFIGSAVAWLADPGYTKSQAATIVGEALAAGGLVVAAVLLIRRIRETAEQGSKTSAAFRLADLLLMFTLVCAVATMKTRLFPFPEDAMSSRYLFIPALFWLALLFRLAAWPAPGRRLRWLAPGLMAALGMGLVLGTDTYFTMMADRSFDHRLRAVAAVMKENVPPPTFAPPPGVVSQIYADYAMNGTSVYADAWPHWLGMKADNLAPADSPACQGSIGDSSAVNGSSDSRIDGRLTRQDGSSARAWLAFANREATVIGLGTSGAGRKGEAGKWLPSAGFAGYVRGQKADVASVYAWFGGGNWCRLAVNQ